MRGIDVGLLPWQSLGMTAVEVERYEGRERFNRELDDKRMAWFLSILEHVVAQSVSWAIAASFSKESIPPLPTRDIEQLASTMPRKVYREDA